MPKIPKKKTVEKMTLERLAEMVARGFEQTATKSELAAVEHCLTERFDHVDERLDRIENLLLREHLNRIEKLEDAVRLLKTKAGIR